MALSNELKQKLITIAENIQKVYNTGVADGNSDAVRATIYLTNGISIQSRASGIWIVDGEEETQLYDSQWQQLQAQFSDYASEADRAFYDPEERELKGTSIQDYGDMSNSYVSLYDRDFIVCGVADGTFDIELPEECPLDYSATLIFSASSGLYLSTSTDVYFKGDHTSEGIFNPESDTRYTIKFEYNGERFVGTVSGVPTM